jgi:hypothetical protein
MDYLLIHIYLLLYHVDNMQYYLNQYYPTKHFLMLYNMWVKKDHEILLCLILLMGIVNISNFDFLKKYWQLSIRINCWRHPVGKINLFWENITLKRFCAKICQKIRRAGSLQRYSNRKRFLKKVPIITFNGNIIQLNWT